METAARAPRIRPLARRPDPQRIRLDREAELARELSGHPWIAKWLASASAGLVESRDVLRRQHLAGSLRITEGVSPYLYKITETVRRTLHVDQPVEFFVQPSSEMNAFCSASDGSMLVVLTSAAIERLGARELLFLVGHELGHGLLGHHALPVQAMLEARADAPSIPWGTALRLLSWSRACEVSADRFGMLCCQDPVVATGVFLTLASGLSGRFLGTAQDFGSQVDDLLQAGGWDGTQLTHPLLPTRVHCCRVFAMSEYMTEHTLGMKGARYSMKQADEYAVQHPFRLDPDPSVMLDDANATVVRTLVALAGVAVIASDGDIDAGEAAGLREIVGEQSLREALTVAEEGGLAGLVARLSATFAESGSELTATERIRILTQLVLVASLDDHLHSMEIAILRGVTECLELPVSLLDVMIEQLRAGQNPCI